MGINRALVVDDSKLARLTMSRLLEQRGIAVDQVASGAEALSYLESTRPDVVFMDVTMPDMDGFETTRAILGEAGHADLPVIMCTAEETPEAQARAREVGARGFLPKPTTDERLDKVLGELAAAASAAAPAPAAPAPAGPDLAAIEARVRAVVEDVVAAALEEQVEVAVRRVLETAVVDRARQEAEKAAQAQGEILRRDMDQHLEALIASPALQERVQAMTAAATPPAAPAPDLEDMVARAGTRAAEELTPRMDLELDERLGKALQSADFRERVRNIAEETLETAGGMDIESIAAQVAERTASRVAERVVGERGGGGDSASLQSALQNATRAAQGARSTAVIAMVVAGVAAAAAVALPFVL